MNQFKAHIPPFMDIPHPSPVEFNTLDELLQIPFVSNFSEEENFYRFSLAGYSLMAEFDEGREWWVVGSISRPGALNLPVWKPGDKTS